MMRTRCLPFLLLGLVFCIRAEDPAKKEPAKPALPDLSEFKTVDTAIKTTVSRSIAEPTSSQPAYLGIHLDRNAAGKLIVSHVAPDSPAAKAGVKVGDQLRDLAGKGIKDTEALRDLLSTMSPEQACKLTVVRENKPMDLSTTLAAVSRPMTGPDSSGRPAVARAILGVQVELDKDAVKVTSITSSGAAEKAGLKVGDRLLKIEDKAVTTTDQLREILGSKKPGDTVKLIVSRDGKDQKFEAKLDSDGSAASNDDARRGWDTRAARLFTRDTYRLAVIPIDYPDVKHNSKVTAKDWEKALFSRSEYTAKSPTGQTVYGSMNDYYVEQSCGALKVTGKVFDPVEVSKKREEYGASGAAKEVLLGEAVTKLLARDKDALKDFDGLFFLYSGNRVQTQRGGLYWPHRATFSHNGKRWGYFICPEGGTQMSSISVISHEFGHMLGLPDLYAKPENPGSEGLGVWCTMSTGHGRDGKPLHFSAWCKEQMGWLKPAVIDPRVKQKLILNPIETTTKECFKVLIRPDGSEYLLLENRTKKGFDKDLPAEGLLIWRVVNNRPVLEESHGIAGPSGPSRYLNAVPYPSSSNNSFTPLTTPSSKALSGSGLPVHITNIQRLPDGRITFFVGYEYY